MRLTSGLKATKLRSATLVLALVAVAALGFGNPAIAASAKPANQVPPSITGTPTSGSVLSGNVGTWNPTGTISRAWYSCSAALATSSAQAPKGCTAISGATGASFTLQPAQGGTYVSFAVTEKNTAGSTTVWSPTTAVISGPPAVASPATVSGSASLDATLTANTGTWYGYPVPTKTQSWYLCNTAPTTASLTVPVGCVLRAGPSSATTYKVLSSDLGKFLIVCVTGTNTFPGTATSCSASAPTLAYATTVPVVSGTALVGSNLSVSAGTFVAYPSTLTTSYQWYRCTSQVLAAVTVLPAGCTVITGATAATRALTSTEAGFYVTAATLKTNTAGVSTTWSASSGLVSSAPISSVKPSFTGGLTTGSILTGSIGTWTGSPNNFSYNYAWYACSAAQLAGSAATVPTGCVDAGTPTAVATGGDHSCALLANRTVKCWGNNSAGQLGNGTTNTSLTPVLVSGITTATAITAGDLHTCALLAAGTVSCWGSGSYGKLGTGSSDSLTPVSVASLSGVAAISAGSSHTCALLTVGTIKCWGFGADGQIGDGTSSISKATPATVLTIASATSLSSGKNSSCATLSDGTAKCWGANIGGQLGDGTKTTRSTPVTVLGSAGVSLTGVSKISVGWDSACAVLTTREVRCWGANSVGQLGTGNTTESLYPVSNGITTAASVSVGYQFACAALVDKTLKCWGSNAFGQLGDATTTDRLSPTVSRASSVASISSANKHVCSFLAEGAISCWGQNSSGQIGANSVGSSVTSATAPTGLSGITYQVGSVAVNKYLIFAVKATNSIGTTLAWSASTLITGP